MINTFYNFINEHNIYDKNVYDYYLEHSDNFDYYNEEFLINWICCKLIFNCKGFLKEIRPFVPNVVDDKTALININQYVHTLLTYNYLNKKFKLNDDCEILPKFYEKLYVLESNNNSLIEYEEFLDMAALESNDKKYLLAVNMFNELLNTYDYNKINDMIKKTKRLIKKY